MFVYLFFCQWRTFSQSLVRSPARFAHHNLCGRNNSRFHIIIFTCTHEIYSSFLLVVFVHVLSTRKACIDCQAPSQPAHSGTYTHKPFKALLLLISELKHDSIQFPMNKRIFVFVSSFFCQLFCSFARSKNGDFRVENFKLIAFKPAFITI